MDHKRRANIWCEIMYLNQLTLGASFTSLLNTPEEQGNQECSNQYQHPADYEKFPVDKRQVIGIKIRQKFNISISASDTKFRLSDF
jgi:hypothetical protein